VVVSSNSTDAPFPLSKTNTIDAAFVQDAKTGKNYLTYGSWWANIWQFELTKDLKSVKIPTARQLSYTYDPVLPTKEFAYANMSLTWGGASAEEAPYINYNKKQGFYYLWYSAGLCCGYNPAALPPPGAEYTIFVGRSKSPRGPFVDRDGKDLAEGGGSMVYGSHGPTYAPGGQAVVSNYHGGDVLYYHYVNTTFDPLYRDNLKFLGWNPIEYVKGWPVLVV
jgi:arabinan endo-1,5-alpha-L-arabinosidase